MARILLVDDDERQRLLYREELEHSGHVVFEASDGREALQRLAQHPADAVVLDINMPSMDGLETLARLHDQHRRTAVILNSAYAAYRDQFVSWIADAYVTKSSDLGVLVSTVADVLDRRERAAAGS